jgi:hypothetical protein
MRLLFESRDSAELAGAKTLLESSGIPVFISGTESFRLRPLLVLYRKGLWICLDEQLQDAMVLLKNPNHRVAKPVDVEAFHQSLEQAQKQPLGALGLDAEKVLNAVMVVVVIALLAAGLAAVLFT